VEVFTEARAALDFMSRELSQAIATSGIQFYMKDKNHIYFVAPLASDPANDRADLCEVGYEYEKEEPPPTAPGKWTFKIRRRLTEPNATTTASGGLWDFYTNPSWWNASSFDKEAALATNSVMNLEFQYWDATSSSFVSGTYDSKTKPKKLPPAILIALDVVDSRTATRLRLVPNVSPTSWESITNSTLRTFSTIVYLRNAVP
jgi:hypothetical protein